MNLTAPEETKGARRAANAAWFELPTGDKFPLAKRCLIGRSPTNEVALPGERVSRQHARLQFEGASGFWLTDLGSVNGTWVNGQRVTRATRLYDGDCVGIGPHRLTFRQPAGAARPQGERSLAERTIGDVEVVACWLLLLQLESPSRVELSAGPDQVPVLVSGWTDRCRQIVEERGGAVQRYLQDGFLASWRDQEVQRVAFGRCLGALSAVQASGPPPFRLVVHYGLVQIRAGLQAQDALAGAPLNAIYRLEHLARKLRSPTLVSQAAHAQLAAHLRMVEAGRHCLPGSDEEQLCYQLEPLGS